ncbi:hypothetical protein Tther_00501 [Tepidimonas thermarum]|uniref:Uncharacterized protein n=1 Tax=Tepidimonas thermarum TaxID=335431 RepID=A0A554X6H8_9BURK|nr:hypothetical protein [Tepidimonas thermarum]TSE31442.1 hypothetical protein Tther_00501 [Tepidimonas thermarum]
MLALFWHGLNLVAPAWGVAALLAPALAWRALPGTRARALLAHGAWLGLTGSAVMVAGLVLQGRDGRMVTYAALVAVMGALAAWRDRGRTR